MSNSQEKFASAARNVQAQAADAKEVQLWEGCFSAKAMFGQWLAALLVTLVGLVAMLAISALRDNSWAWLAWSIVVGLVWLSLVAVALYHKLGHYYELTNQRLKHRDGILIRTVNRVELIDMDDVVYRQGPIQMMLDVGDITIKSSDASHPELVLKGIAGVRKVAEMIDDARRQERHRRGLHIASI